MYFKVSPIAEQPLPLRWCWVGVAVYALPPFLILRATSAYLQKVGGRAGPGARWRVRQWLAVGRGGPGAWRHACTGSGSRTPGAAAACALGLNGGQRSPHTRTAEEPPPRF